MNQAFRLSRIKAPRGTIAAIVLLAVVFIAFGLVISSASPEHAAMTPRYFDNTALTFANWLLGNGGN
jgi:hypothetical protein